LSAAALCLPLLRPSASSRPLPSPTARGAAWGGKPTAATCLQLAQPATLRALPKRLGQPTSAELPLLRRLLLLLLLLGRASKLEGYI
jgi:hypothetical protein